MTCVASAAILAGGLATRLGGIAKPLIEVDGCTILERQWRVLSSVFDDIAVVGFRGDLPAFASGARRLVDRVAHCGPVGGIEVALREAVAPFVFVVAGDMPYLNAGVVRRMLHEARGNVAAVIPVSARGVEPLHSVYSVRCQELAMGILSGKSASARRFVQAIDHSLECRFMDAGGLAPFDPEMTFLTNINAPSDLR